MNLSTDQVIFGIQSTVQDNIQGSLTGTGEAEMNKFLADIKPDLQEALVAEDQLSLDFIKDRINGKAASIILETNGIRAQQVAAAINSSLDLLLKIGLTAILA